MRLLAGLGLLAPPAVVALALLLVLERGRALPDDLASVPALAAAAILGAAVTAALATTWLRGRVVPVVRSAERIADGDMEAAVPLRTAGLDGRLAAALTSLRRTLAETTDAATTDRLTGVSNRTAVLARLFGELERVARYERPLSVGFVDIDHFKAVNDTYGHHAGDIVLRGVANALRANLRGSDALGRYGGEEFLVILPETGADDAANLAEKLRQVVLRERFEVAPGTSVSVTVSIGVSGGTGRALHVDTLVRDADAAMFSAKSLGRNQVYVFAEPNEDSRVPRAPISGEGRDRAIAVGRLARSAAEQSLIETLMPLANHRGHPSPLIGMMAVTIARRLGLPEAEIDRLRIAALLHDVGKLALPDEILEKPAALTSSEWQSVVQHPRIGQVILEQASAIRDAVPIVLHHHERFSGHGYPYGLRANDIPLGARIVALADAYDAMTNDRPYKRAIGHEQAIREIRRHAGTQFDPELVEVFCELYAERAPVVDPRVVATALERTLRSPDVAPARRRRRASSGGMAAAG